MNKELWVKAKDKREYTVDILYEFWQNNKKPKYKDLTLEEFAPLIQEYMNMGGFISVEKLEKYFDNRLNIVKVYDKNNRLIKEL